jgi:integrase
VIFAYPVLTQAKGLYRMRAKLTPQLVASVKADPTTDRTIIWDESLPNFGLVITAAGHRSFIVQYRANGRSRRMAIKATLRLGEARKEARAILGKVAKDRDPLTERRKAEASAENTLQSVAEKYFQREGKTLRTVKERRRTLARLVFPRLGAKQIEDIKRSDIVKLLDRIEDESGPAMASHTLAYLRKILNWHAGRSDDYRSPVVRGMARTKAKEQARDRILADDELRAIWKAAGEMNNAFGPLVRFLLLTATRRDEAARIRRSEINGEWTIPGARYKSKRDHVIPLSGAAKAVIASVPVIGDRDLVFTHDGKRPVGGFSKFKAALDKSSGVTGWRLHDLRRTARSLMSRVGVDSDIAERALGHVLTGVRGTYDRHAYLEEKRKAFEKLATLIEQVINPQENVIALRDKR